MKNQDETCGRRGRTRRSERQLGRLLLRVRDYFRLGQLRSDEHSVDVIGEGLFCEEDAVGDFIAFDDWFAALNEFFIDLVILTVMHLPKSQATGNQEKNHPVIGMVCSAQGGIRTPTAARPLDPEPSVSTSFTTWACERIVKRLTSVVNTVGLNFIRARIVSFLPAPLSAFSSNGSTKRSVP